MNRRVVARIASGVALLAGVWTFFLLSYPGFDAVILGVKVTTHEPLRPLAITLLAIAVLVAANGVARTVETATSGLLWIRHIGGRIDDRPIVGLLAIAVVAVGVGWNTRSAGGADSYGYVSEADLWLSGHLTISQPWMPKVPWPGAGWDFSPLGYRPGRDDTTIVPKYSAGLPLLMAFAKRIGGQPAMFWIVPLLGGVLVLGTYGIGRRIGSPAAGLIAAWLVATSPATLMHLVQPLSDVPVAAAWTVSLWCLLGDTTAWALAAGLAAALAVLIRPNLVPVAGIMGIWLAVEAWRARGTDRTHRFRQCLGFAAAVLPAVVAQAALNQLWYGAPGQSGYGSLSELFAWSNVVPNIKNYAGWFVETQTPIAVLGIAALFAPGAWLWPREARRPVVVLFALLAAVLWAEYCAYSVFDVWWYLRFLLPAWPLVMIGLAVVMVRPMRSGRPLVIVAIAILALGLGLHGLRLARDRDAFEMQWGESKYASIAAIVRARTDPNAMIFSMQHSGTLRYYGGRMTLSFFNLEVPLLDSSVAWLAGHGVHPYALLEDWEVGEFRTRFSAKNTLGRLKMQPMLEYYGPARIYLFDLLRPEDADEPATVRILDAPHPVGWPVPAPPAAIVFKN